MAERGLRILQIANEIMATLPHWATADEEYFAAYRRAMIDAGATDADLAYFSDYLVRLVVAMTAGKPDDRSRLLDAVVNHFALTDMDVHLGKDDMTVIRVLFPDRPRPQ